MPSNATETIDVRILRLIGLEDVFDLDYDTYLTLLKEAMVKGRMPKTTIPSEEVELLTNEWKRVKSKKDKGRFKVKKKKITATALKIGSIKGKITGVNPSKLLPAAIPAAKEGGSGGFNIGESFSKIAESVTSIAKTLREKNKLSKKETAFDRRAEENEKRKLQKENLKKRFSKMASVAQKIMQPVQSLLDKLINYFLMIFLGNAALKLFDWFTDKENQDKISTIVRFVEDWWPLLLGGYILFGTGLGGLIFWLLPAVSLWSLRLARLIIKHPVLSAALAGTLITKAIVDNSQTSTENVLDEKGLSNASKEDQSKALMSLSGLSSTLTGTINPEARGEDKPVEDKPAGKIFGLIPYPKPGSLVSGHRGGGIIPGEVYDPDDDGDNIVDGPGGNDKVPAWLTKGETVMAVGGRERQIAMTGVDPLWFNTGPNANKPQMKKSWMMAGGGLVPGYSDGGVVGGDPFKAPTMKMLKAYEGIGKRGITKPYKVPGEHFWTIGYGATRLPPWITGEKEDRDVEENDRITAKQADELKEHDYNRHKKIVEDELKLVGISLRHHVPVNVGSVLLSLAFNYGSLRGAHRGTSSRWGPKGKMTFPNSLPVMVQIAQQSGEWGKIADLLEYNLSQEANAGRRKSEARIIRTGSGTGFHGLDNLNAPTQVHKVGEGKVGEGTVGRRGLHTSLTDNEGMSQHFPKWMKNLIPGPVSPSASKFHSGGMIPKQSGSNLKVPSPPSRTPVVVNTTPSSIDNVDMEISNPSTPTLPLMDVTPFPSYKAAILGIG